MLCHEFGNWVEVSFGQLWGSSLKVVRKTRSHDLLKLVGWESVVDFSVSVKPSFLLKKVIYLFLDFFNFELKK